MTGLWIDRRYITQWRDPVSCLSIISFSPLVLTYFAGIGASQSIRAALLVLGQLIVGYIVADLALPRHRGASEVLMWAAPIGFGAFGVSGPILVALDWNSGLSLVGIFSAAVLIHFFFSSRSARSGDTTNLTTLFVVVIIAISLVNGPSNPFLFVVGVCVVAVVSAHGLTEGRVYSSRLVFFGVAIPFGIWALNRISDNGRFKQFLLRPLLYGSDDQIYSEQMASSIAHFGIGENTAAVGTIIKYHWLTLSWSGGISKTVGLENWIGTLYIVPYFLAGAIAASVAFAVSSLRSGPFTMPPARLSQAFSVLIPLVLFGSYSVLDDNGALYVNNTSNLGGHLWAVPLVFVLVHLKSRSTYSDLILVSVGSAALMLAKGPYAVPVAATSVVAFAMVCSEGNLQKRLPQATVVSGMLVSMALCYLLFVRGASNTSYKLDLGTITRFPHPLQHPTGFGFPWVVFVPIALLGWVITRFWFVILLAKRHTALVGIAGVGLMFSSFLTFILDGLGGTSYFLNASIFNASILMLFIVHTRLSLTNLFRDLVVGASVGVFILFIRVQYPQRVLGMDLWVIVFPFVVLVSVVLRKVAIQFRSQETEPDDPCQVGLSVDKGKWILGILAASSISITLSSYFFGTGSAIVETRPHSSALISEQEIHELAEIRDITKPTDIVATNRYLCPSWVQLYDCASEMGDPSTLSSHLFSATLNRRTLIDGPRFVISGDYWESQYPTWLTRRLDALYSFLSDPNESGSQALIGFDVDYVAVHLPSLNVALSNGWTTKSIKDLALKFETKLKTNNYLLIKVDQ